jgi:MoaA/NifB/PqqE/SkfB family radical SAM enzyme
MKDMTTEKRTERFKFLHFVVTVNCPLRCKMCQNWKNDVKNEIEAEYITGVIDELHKNNLFTHDANIIFGGAEALLRKDVFDLVRFAEARGLCTTVGTSGYLYNDTIGREISDSGLRCLALSLDSLDAKKHNYLRGRDGVFENIMRITQKHPRKTSLTCTISAYNLDEICQLAEWVEANDDISQMGFQAVVMPFNSSEPGKDWFRNPAFEHLWPKDLSVVNRNIDKLVEIRKRSRKIYTTPEHLNFFKEYFRDPNSITRSAKCRVGDHSVTVMNHGDVVFCHSLPPLGNAREKGIVEIMTSPAVQETRQKMLDCTSVCEFYVNCFFGD